MHPEPRCASRAFSDRNPADGSRSRRWRRRCAPTASRSRRTIRCSRWRRWRRPGSRPAWKIYRRDARRDDRGDVPRTPTARRCCRRWSGWARSRAGRAAIERDLAREAIAATVARRAGARVRASAASLEAAIARADLHVACRGGSVDERGFAVLQAVRAVAAGQPSASASHELKALFRDQYLLLRLDEERAIRRHPATAARRSASSAQAAGRRRSPRSLRRCGDARPTKASGDWRRCEALFGVSAPDEAAASGDRHA